MPSVLSHPAAALGLSRMFGVSRPAVVAGAILAIVPDADAIGFWLGVPYGAPLGHRGLTHSIAFAALSAAVALALLRRSARAVPAAAVFAYLFLCAVSHGLLDGMTDGGLGVAYFAPFSNERYFLPWRPIPVSPISVTGFFSDRGPAILAAEILWIWLPCAGLALVGATRRASRSRSAKRA